MGCGVVVGRKLRSKRMRRRVKGKRMWELRKLGIGKIGGGGGVILRLIMRIGII